jgi:hypothetical protein
LGSQVFTESAKAMESAGVIIVSFCAWQVRKRNSNKKVIPLSLNDRTIKFEKIRLFIFTIFRIFALDLLWWQHPNY